MSDEKQGAPAWMVSFGDMMTLILTFFILLVSMSSVQQVGLVASGVGSFLLAVRSFGLPGVLGGEEQAAIYEHVRERFNLPPEDDPERRDEHAFASNLELVRAKAADALRPHDEIAQPALALFDEGSSELTESSRRYIDLLATTIRPSAGQVLLLEGHADEAEAPGSRSLLAFERARSVLTYLVEAHAFPELRLEARAWIQEIAPPGPELRSVDARLVIPQH